MGRIKEPESAKLFMSVFTPEESLFQQGLDAFHPLFGEIDFVSERFSFHLTDYYREEMGGPLFRQIDFVSERFSFHLTDYYREEMGGPLFRHFITFERLISRALLSEIKQTTNRLEGKFANAQGNRRLNIDPGYLCLEHVILATTKSYTHRPYLKDGIYADLTLIYRNKSYQPLE
ncbi:MAG: hypothetical protein A2W09_07705, partial [Deltaproteobacteria bacterium RBG_16_50_11]